jgi:hypothetical protein
VLLEQLEFGDGSDLETLTEKDRWLLPPPAGVNSSLSNHWCAFHQLVMHRCVGGGMCVRAATKATLALHADFGVFSVPL